MGSSSCFCSNVVFKFTSIFLESDTQSLNWCILQSCSWTFGIGQQGCLPSCKTSGTQTQGVEAGPCCAMRLHTHLNLASISHDKVNVSIEGEGIFEQSSHHWSSLLVCLGLVMDGCYGGDKTACRNYKVPVLPDNPSASTFSKVYVFVFKRKLIS